MLKRILVFYFVLTIIGTFPALRAFSQYLNAPANPDYLQQYVEADPQNWNKSIIYVFYNNNLCDGCAAAMGMIYNIYEQNYSNQYSYFEINYEDPGEFNFQTDFDLTQPLNIVLVRVRDGLNMGSYKIENPQIWMSDPSYFTQNIITQINNFFNS